MGRGVFSVLVLLLAACSSPESEPESNKNCSVELIVLGIGQDGGAPQIANPQDPAWTDTTLRLRAASLGLIDHRTGSRFLFEATPDIRSQLQSLDEYAESTAPTPGLDGIFLTHAHIGHYAGLMLLGHESMGANGVNVYAMPRMKEYLSTNGPWDQLVRYQNIVLQSMTAESEVVIGNDLAVIPYLVPHRDEYSETVGFVLTTPDRSALFLPDIDDWDRWEIEYGTRIEDMIEDVDLAFLDATFFDNNEIPGRDMSGFPHPRLKDSMARFSALPPEQQRKIRFIHLNHTNPARFPESPASTEIISAGFSVAEENEIYCLHTE